jgi:hypothetical protein
MRPLPSASATARAPLRWLALGLSCLALAGCASSSLPLSKCQASSREILPRIDARKVIDELVVGICPSAPAFDSLLPLREGEGKDAVVVPDFVDVHTLQPDRMGVALGDLFRASIFNICRVPIRQAELSRNFRLNPGGLTALTRNPAEVREKAFPASVAMIGTYNLDGNKLTLIARRVDVETATFMAVVSKEVSWSCQSATFGDNQLVIQVK